MGDGRKATRKRAVGTREHITAYLTEVGELRDANGMASTQLAAAVGYPGSSVAFAQLLSGMERSGLIKREVRGKRTYRISLDTAQAAGAFRGAVRSAMSAPGAAGVAADEPGGPLASLGSGLAGFDYDELARRLLVQVVRRISEQEGRAAKGGRGQIAGDEQRLAEENIRLREQLRVAQRSLALAAERARRLPVTSDQANGEIALLQRLLSPWVRAEGADVGLGA
jgi:hypothetical protein